MKKKMMTAVLAMTMVATAVAGCGSSSGSGTTVELTNEAGGDAQAEIQKAEADQTAAEGTVYKVGIVQYVDDASLNQIEKAIEAELTAKGAELGCEFPYKSRVMGTSEPLKPLKAPYMARNPVKWVFFRLKGQEIPLKI